MITNRLRSCSWKKLRRSNESLTKKTRQHLNQSAMRRWCSYMWCSLAIYKNRMSTRAVASQARDAYMSSGILLYGFTLRRTWSFVFVASMRQYDRDEINESERGEGSHLAVEVQVNNEFPLTCMPDPVWQSLVSSSRATTLPPHHQSQYTVGMLCSSRRLLILNNSLKLLDTFGQPNP